MLFRSNVFILGAGFSADAGVPVMRNFMQAAKDLMENPKSGLPEIHQTTFRGVFDYLYRLRSAQGIISFDVENIEHLFGIAEMEIESRGRDLLEFRQNLITLILQTLERSAKSALTKDQQVVTLETGGLRQGRVNATYTEMFAALSSRRWLSGEYGVRSDGTCRDTVITMNYDCLLDDALLKIGVMPDYALPNACYPREVAREARIHLLKLHGSVNWLHCTNGSCRKPLQVWPGGPAERLDYGGRPCRSCSSRVEPVIVPPTWAKGGRMDIFAPIWSQALQALEEAGQIFIIGYSMPDTDAFFKYMLASALKTNRMIDRIVVVNTNREVLERYAQLFQQPFVDKRFNPVEQLTSSYIWYDTLLGNHLGQFQVGLDRGLIQASGFTVS
jgi:NAD-dependent SIR2 family protein deacetylase